MGFYRFNQNNSGGSFVEDEDLTHTVFIEAGSAKEANARAENFGIYFDGCNSGIDCDCCGDRWYEAGEGDYYSLSSMKAVRQAIKELERYHMFTELIAIVHLRNGDRYAFAKNEEVFLKSGKKITLEEFDELSFF